MIGTVKSISNNVLEVEVTILVSVYYRTDQVSNLDLGQGGTDLV
ncbi:Uncharacterised protein [Streptococcus pneumoniae]|nr:Uncharacterised protein [Streptococcus pneumoniae]